jgi:serine phosphatase RsbU (regulator of sigma subunit)
MRLISLLKKWWGRKLRRRLFVSSVLTVSLSLIVLGYLSFRIGQAGVQFEVNQRNSQLTTLVANDINAQFNNTWLNIRLLMLQLATSTETLTLQASAMLELRRASPLTYRALYLFDNNNQLLIHLGDPLESLLAIQDVAEIINRPAISTPDEVLTAYQSAKNGALYVSPTTIMGFDQVPAMYLGVPLVTRLGQTGQVVVAKIDLRDIWRRVDEIRIGQTGRAFVVSQEGIIIAHPNRTYIGQGITPELRPVLNGFEGQTEYQDPISNKIMLAAYSPVGGQSNWGVIVEQERDEALARINNIAFIGFGVLFVALVIATVLTVLIARDVTQPIQRLAQVTQNIAWTGDLSRDITIERQDEVGQLAATFNQMIAGLREAQADLLKTQAITQELSIAHKIQSGLLPASSLSLPEFDIAAISIPARQVGGDFYGYYQLPSNSHYAQESLAIAVGDVSGKGLPAALYMAVSSSALAAKAQSVPDVTQLYAELNALLYPRMTVNRMNTALLYVHLTKNGFFSSYPTWGAEIINAGLIAPLFKREDYCDYLDVGGLPLGVLSNPPTYHKTKLPLQPNDWLVLCSDGIVEAMNEHQDLYGFDRLKQRAAMFKGKHSRELLEWIIADVRIFTNGTEPHDDMTVLVMRFKGEKKNAPGELPGA